MLETFSIYCTKTQMSCLNQTRHSKFNFTPFARKQMCICILYHCRQDSSSSLSVGHSESRRMTDELGSRQRDLSTSSVTKRANGHWHAIIASSCRWSQREYKRQPVHRINHPFASEPSSGVSLLLFLTLRVRSFTSAGVTAQQRWSRSHGRTTVREDSHTGVCGGQLPCVLQH